MTEKTEKKCGTCKHSGNEPQVYPCSECNCIGEYFKKWEPKVEVSGEEEKQENEENEEAKEPEKTEKPRDNGCQTCKHVESEGDEAPCVDCHDIKYCGNWEPIEESVSGEKVPKFEEKFEGVFKSCEPCFFENELRGCRNIGPGKCVNASLWEAKIERNIPPEPFLRAPSHKMIVEWAESEEMTKGGILLPKKSQENVHGFLHVCEVKFVGEFLSDEYKVGELIWCGSWAGSKGIIRTMNTVKTYQFIDKDDVLGVANPEFLKTNDLLGG